MKKLQNENAIDRLIRIVLAVATATIGYNSNGTAKVIWMVVAAIATISGLTGFSLFYKLVGISTLKSDI